jgi:transposase
LGALEWSRAVADSSHVQAKRGHRDGPSPVDRARSGSKHHRLQRVTADRGYDHDKYRRELRLRGIAPEIARRQTEHGSGLGRARWVVERTFAWLRQFKRLLGEARGQTPRRLEESAGPQVLLGYVGDASSEDRPQDPVHEALLVPDRAVS